MRLPRLPWLIRAIWQPDIELDLIDKSGRPDHGKTVGILAFSVDVILIVAGLTPPLGIFIALNSVVFGWVGWRTFLNAKVVTAREEEAASVVREVVRTERTERTAEPRSIGPTPFGGMSNDRP